jgi:hypothetical protein
VAREAIRCWFMNQICVSPVLLLYQTMSALASAFMSLLATIRHGGPIRAALPFS